MEYPMAITENDDITTTEGRQALFANAKEAVTEAVQSAVEAVKANPKTAAAIAAGATAAVAGAAYGATKLSAAKATPAKSTTTAPKRRAPAKRTTTAAKSTPAKK
ncbi:hypothetical protein ASE86_10225 [Sphingomonas sp. Leaf33]|nr:hypothetical protein ASE86_10225 [Sphingomonas sp. Leaf33]